MTKIWRIHETARKTCMPFAKPIIVYTMYENNVIMKSVKILDRYITIMWAFTMDASTMKEG